MTTGAVARDALATAPAPYALADFVQDLRRITADTECDDAHVCAGAYLETHRQPLARWHTLSEQQTMVFPFEVEVSEQRGGRGVGSQPRRATEVLGNMLRPAPPSPPSGSW
jgi:hypothetical protein